MPLIRIEVVDIWSEDELDLLMQALHEAMVSAFEVPDRDRYQVLTSHRPGRLIMQDTGLGFERSDRRVLVQVTTRPRSNESKRMFYALAASHLVERLNMHSEDVMIAFVENTDID
ncbi:Tautomerase enzyme [Devosia sp. YR412]|uniref:tautomerase family protein n=1 Tax=Devosia sp. YR412 TaxID=1881030 RepID=UPI0008C1521A|nr:tautomerase family protein [Devosia sp. YR412]SEQ10054.1 Tautomerase enzyme [Devosia sp. YR412]